MLDANGQIAASLVVKLTDVPVKLCEAGGDYRRAEILSKRIVDSGVTVRDDPAYTVQGSALRIQLAPSELCDDGGYAVIGGVTEAGFEGMYMPEAMFFKTRPKVLPAFGVSLPN